ncbi:tyrosine-type recombinase/integrase [Ottowia pentelensis]|uniref:Tyrosine-type recombinase/integrase n=1 Tax=Ottowia pentelensis TaxID=511108 RepID=A0ABV6PW78_9BURK
MLTRAGGEPFRGGLTVAGPLHPLLALPLKELSTATIETWAQREGQHRPTSARLAWRLLRAFLSWCAEHPDYKTIVPAQNPAKSRRAREALGKAGVKSDALMRGQLTVWFAAVRAIGNAGISAYLQTLLLTGARPGELLGLRWDDMNVQWHGLTIRDKVEGERVIPLTPYVHHLLAGLPRRGRYLFSATDKPLSYPQRPHGKACAVAGVEGLTLHGLRRSFKSLSEWLELPVGVIAQIQGHKPSATAEKHYTVRPLDLLRLHHEKFEAWILEQAGVKFDASTEPGKLRAMTA